ncbi:hypothetical protein [Nonomuraea dietziae]|uniref:hypothetical protein n=1 Tax=Nonomuraea dietziae TaxID=65515 RepID=UPI00342EF9ED
MALGTGIFLLCVALGLQFVKRLLRVVCVLAAIAGIGVAIGLKGTLRDLTSEATWGVSIGAGLAAIALIVFVCQVVPKLGTPKRWMTPLIGVLLPSLLVIGIGGAAGKALRTGLDKGGGAVDQAVTTVIGPQGGSR